MYQNNLENLQTYQIHVTDDLDSQFEQYINVCSKLHRLSPDEVFERLNSAIISSSLEEGDGSAPTHVLIDVVSSATGLEPQEILLLVEMGYLDGRFHRGGLYFDWYELHLFFVRDLLNSSCSPDLKILPRRVEPDKLISLAEEPR